MRRRKLKNAKYEVAKNGEQVHDRTTSDIPLNAQIAVDTVDDPYERGSKVTVVRSIRDDPLAGMYSRQQIDLAQFTAGRMWQKFYEQSEIGSVSAIDTTKEAVDGGGIYQPIGDRQMAAMGSLREAHKTLGAYDTALVMAVLGKRESLGELAVRWCMITRREVEFLGIRFRAALESLAILWKLAPPKRGPLLDIDMRGANKVVSVASPY